MPGAGCQPPRHGPVRAAPPCWICPWGLPPLRVPHVPAQNAAPNPFGVRGAVGCVFPCPGFAALLSGPGLPLEAGRSRGRLELGFVFWVWFGFGGGGVRDEATSFASCFAAGLLPAPRSHPARGGLFSFEAGIWMETLSLAQPGVELFHNTPGPCYFQTSSHPPDFSRPAFGHVRALLGVTPAASGLGALQHPPHSSPRSAELLPGPLPAPVLSQAGLSELPQIASARCSLPLCRARLPRPSWDTGTRLGWEGAGGTGGGGSG